MLDGDIIVEIFGEGKTDIGPQTKPELPKSGVVPIMVHKLCGNPSRMKVIRKRTEFLQGKGLWQKVKFARRQAFYNKSDAAVFVVDSEGEFKAKKEALNKGRDAVQTSVPMAIGIAHPCIESWLLADPNAIKKGLNLSTTPEVPANPEELFAPQINRNHNPKTVLRDISGLTHKELSVVDKDHIAAALNDLNLVRNKCLLGFAPFADEVEAVIRPLFSTQ